MSFRQQTVWITGATSGIGEHLAYTFAREGANLVLLGRNMAALERVQQMCLTHTNNVMIQVLDISDYEKVAAVLQTILTQTDNAVDILINNAGISQRALAAQTQLSVDKQLMDTNYLGTIAVTKAVLPVFLQKRKGHIVTITSVVGKIGTPMRSSYAASKHALHGFFDSLRAELPETIAVTLICPGFVQTNVSINALTGDGTPQQIMDNATANGLTPDKFCQSALRAIAARKPEVAIAGIKERFGMLAGRFYPQLLRRLLRRIAVT